MRHNEGRHLHDVGPLLGLRIVHLQHKPGTATTTAATTTARQDFNSRQCGISLPAPEEPDFVAARILCKQCLCKYCRRIHGLPRTLGSVDEGYNNLLLKALGLRIRQLRTEKGYSQEAFADQCGVHRTFMGTVERGESNLSFQNIAKVATTLGISLSTLFLGLEERAQVFTKESARSRRTPKV